MTVRTAELVMGVFLALFSIGLMYKSADGLAIGWIAGSGPGAGAWPFWLSAGMLLSCLAIIYRWFVRATPESKSDEPYIGRQELTIIATTIVALFFLLLGSHFIGMYFSIVLFLLFYLKVLGGHDWTLSGFLTLATPTWLFFFFEAILQKPLPKGYMEEWFYPLYDVIYGKGGFYYTLAVLIGLPLIGCIPLLIKAVRGGSAPDKADVNG